MLLLWMFNSNSDGTFIYAPWTEICQWTFEIVPQEVLWSIWGSHQRLWSLPLPNITCQSWTWPYTVTIGPDSMKTFQGTCKGNFLCLQMISYEFLRVESIGWIVSRGKHFVHMTRPGARDWPAACFPRPFSQTMTFTTIRQVNKL